MNEDKIIKHNSILGTTTEEIFNTRKFRYEQTIKEMEEYANKMFENPAIKEIAKKPFYHYYEWFGWRFYLKAIKYRDWKSIKGHILSSLRLR